MKFLKLIIIFTFLSISLNSCGGGGGGGSGVSTSDGSKRTTGTGVRMIIGSLDSEPLDLRIGDKYYNRASFMQPNFYSNVSSGDIGLVVERANSPEVIITTLNRNLLPKTEYSILVFGEHLQGNFNLTTIEEPVVRPEPGQVRLQFINLLNNSGGLSLNSEVANIGPVNFGSASGYITIPMPASSVQTFNINSSKRTLTNLSLEFVDQGENTIVVGGNQDQGIIIARVYKDLD